MKLKIVRDALLAWYAENRRDLPWRETTDPYAILVSEIMLQQTGVGRVVPKYRAFLERFPTLAALAAAPRDEVIRLWSGLGYNRRAVYLHRLAQIVVEQYAGVLPRTLRELRSLPGIGPYTAGALASMAFGLDVPALDTNAGRVLGRIFHGATEGNPQKLASLAERLIPPGRAAELNQALMDFASLQCTLSRPACLFCPIREHCLAAPRLLQGELRERRVAETDEPYLASSRYYRGRIVDLLRALSSTESLDLDQMEQGLTAGIGENAVGSGGGSPRLRDLITGLVRDGLVEEESLSGKPRYRLAR